MACIGGEMSQVAGLLNLGLSEQNAFTLVFRDMVHPVRWAQRVLSSYETMPDLHRSIEGNSERRRFRKWLRQYRDSHTRWQRIGEVTCARDYVPDDSIPW